MLPGSQTQVRFAPRSLSGLRGLMGLPLKLMRNKTFHIAKCTEIGRFSANNGRRQGPGMLSARIELSGNDNAPALQVGAPGTG